MWVVSDGLVEFPKLELLLAALGDLADDSGRLAGDDAEARDDHVGRNHGAVEDAHVVLDDGELADDRVVAYVYVGADAGRLHDGVLADEDVVAHAEGHVGEDTFVHAPWGPQTATSTEEAVPADGDGRVVRRGTSAGAAGGSCEVTADHDLLLDHGLAAEHDVLGADQGSFAGDLVAGVGLDVFSSWRAPRHFGQSSGLRTSLVVICDVLFSELAGGPGEFPGRHGPGAATVEDATHFASAK